MQERGNGTGAFLALSIGLFLCEHYFRCKSGTADIWRQDEFLKAAARHFETEAAFFKEFWNVYAHGILQQGIPKAAADFGWDIDDDYPGRPTRAMEQEKVIICLNPWRFTEEMIVVCWNDPVALTKISNPAPGCTSTGPLEWADVPAVEPGS